MTKSFAYKVDGLVEDLSTLPPHQAESKDGPIIRIPDRDLYFPLEVRLIPDQGRGFFATRTIDSGEVVFQALPAAYAVSEDWIKNVCYWCFAYNDSRSWKIKPSAGSGTPLLRQQVLARKCKNVYCSEECREKTEALAARPGGDSLTLAACIGSIDEVASRMRKSKAYGRRTSVSHSKPTTGDEDSETCCRGPVRRSGLLPMVDIDNDSAMQGWLDAAWDTVVNDPVFEAKASYYRPEPGQLEVAKLVAMLNYRAHAFFGEAGRDEDGKIAFSVSSTSGGSGSGSDDGTSSASTVVAAGPDHHTTTAGIMDLGKYAKLLRNATRRTDDMEPPTLQDVMLMQSNELPHFRTQFLHTAGGRPAPDSSDCRHYNYPWYQKGTWSPCMGPIGNVEEGAYPLRVPLAPSATQLLHHYLPPAIQEIMQLYHLYALAMRQVGLPADHRFFRAIYYREMANSFGIWDPPMCTSEMHDQEQELIGCAIYPTAVFFNHSCCPSVTKKREGRVIKFIANQRIEAGQELYISYGNVSEPVGERRRRLLDHYFFLCQCERCVSEHLATLSMDYRDGNSSSSNSSSVSSDRPDND
ncbi:hypothetical protein EV182_000982 [Spiromyces aspiralis]|uniref:Uncharacterized protein n=1 Tax=Spiromyces aspiralis TaxID=68401 RepID=A0ACC1HUK7_9FUNG|nr:hypothetical protein EV182_000982 [Spiromyces aspiralis]